AAVGMARLLPRGLSSPRPARRRAPHPAPARSRSPPGVPAGCAASPGRRRAPPPALARRWGGPCRPGCPPRPHPPRRVVRRTAAAACPPPAAQARRSPCVLRRFPQSPGPPTPGPPTPLSFQLLPSLPRQKDAGRVLFATILSEDGHVEPSCITRIRRVGWVLELTHHLHTRLLTHSQQLSESVDDQVVAIAIAPAQHRRRIRPLFEILPGRLVPKTHVRPIQHGVRAARRRRPPELPGPRSRDPRQHVLDRQAERVTASRDGRPYVHQFLRRTPVRLIRGSWPFVGSVLSTARRIDCPVCAVGQRTWLFRLTSLKMSQQMASPSIRTTLDTWAKLSIRYSATELGIVTFCVKKGRSRFGEGICAVVLVVLSGAAATIARPPTPTLICS